MWAGTSLGPMWGIIVRDYISLLTWEQLHIHQEELQEVGMCVSTPPVANCTSTWKDLKKQLWNLPLPVRPWQARPSPRWSSKQTSGKKKMMLCVTQLQLNWQPFCCQCTCVAKMSAVRSITVVCVNCFCLACSVYLLCLCRDWRTIVLCEFDEVEALSCGYWCVCVSVGAQFGFYYCCWSVVLSYFKSDQQLSTCL